MRELITMAFAARNTLFKILGILLVSLAVELGVFYLTLRANEAVTLEEGIASSRIYWIFALSLLLTVYIISVYGCNRFGSHPAYILNRLPISEKRVTWLWAGYNTMILFFFWAWHIGTALALCWMYTAIKDISQFELTAFFAFYRSDFFHGLLPLSDFAGILRNLLFFPSLGLSAAVFTMMQRRERTFPFYSILAVLGAVTFPMDITWKAPIAVSIVSVFFLLLYGFLMREFDDKLEGEVPYAQTYEILSAGH